MQYMLADPFVPAQAMIDIKKATVYIRDGGVGTAQNELVVKIGEGNVSWTERVEREYMLDRGIIDEVRNGDETPMEVSLDFNWEYIQGKTGTGELPTIMDALKKKGNASAWVSTDADTCRPFAVDIVIEYEPECGTGNNETITFPDFRYEEISGDLRAATFSCSGRCNATEPTAVRS